MSRQLFPVSVKAAIFNDKNEVLMIHMSRRGEYGMPGGHMEVGETPDEAMERELFEEAGVRDCNLKRVDFFIHEGEGKVVLAYTGSTNTKELESAQDNLEGIPVWVSRAMFDKINTHSSYRTFVTRNWPD